MAGFTDHPPPGNIDTFDWTDAQLEQASALLTGMDAILKQSKDLSYPITTADLLLDLIDPKKNAVGRLVVDILGIKLDDIDSMTENGIYFDEWKLFITENIANIEWESNFRAENPGRGHNFDANSRNDYTEWGQEGRYPAREDPNRAFQHLLPDRALCFAAGTLIKLSDNSLKKIEEISIGDKVLSFGINNNDLCHEFNTSRVTRLFLNTATLIIDFFNTKVTPGHVFYRVDGPRSGSFAPLIDILRTDGAIADASGRILRAATLAEVGTVRDAFMEIIRIDRPSPPEACLGRVRAGTLLLRQDGSSVSILELAEQAGYTFDAETGLVSKDGQGPTPLPFAGPIPKPEDYVLARSGLTIGDLQRVTVS